ncbi:MAG: glycosyltransferase, partial [Rhodocyclaceae bacterium]
MIDPERPDYANTPVAARRPGFPYRPAAFLATPTVSVITPFYNPDRVYLETAQSLFAESFQDFEWIIVDDGSSDAEALAMLAATRASDARIRVIVEENAGPAAARNAAFKHSAGRYLCLLDSDDMIEPTFIEKYVWFLESNPAFGFCNTGSVNFGDEEFLWAVGFERAGAHLQADSGPPISAVRREASEAGGGFDESIRFGHEDWDFRLALVGRGVECQALVFADGELRQAIGRAARARILDKFSLDANARALLAGLVSLSSSTRIGAPL